MIVTIASAWNASAGGINAFNIELTRALAKIANQPVICAVTGASDEDVRSAAQDNVTLVLVSASEDGKPAPNCAGEIMLSIPSDSPTEVQLWIGHDLVSGEAAANASASYGGKLALFHHMDYQSYQNFGGDRGDQAMANHRRQIKLFRDSPATLFGVGSWLTDNVARLGGRDAHTIIPGFPAIEAVPARVQTDRLLVVTAGRFSPSTEPLKRIGSALDGFAMAVRDGRDLSRLRHPTMTMLGVTETEMQTILHSRATTLAERPVNVIAAKFDDDPTAVAELASISHVVIVPSRHEGFGLVGWEAIGTGTPLILGEGAGLAHQLKLTLDGQEQGLVNILDLNGSERDSDQIALAIRRIAADVPTAIRRAARLRTQLKAELSCEWSTAANEVLIATGIITSSGSQDLCVGDQPVIFVDDQQNHFERCVELGVSAVQGSTRRSVELVAELRFGVTEIEVEDIEAELALERVTLQVKPRTGRLRRADRLGEGKRETPGVKAQAGGVWIVEPIGGKHLDSKAMGDESLCVVESTGEHQAIVDVEVTTARRHIRCTLRSKRRLSKTVERVMGVFLKDCIYKPSSGHVVLSTATVREEV